MKNRTANNLNLLSHCLLARRGFDNQKIEKHMQWLLSVTGIPHCKWVGSITKHQLSWPVRSCKRSNEQHQGERKFNQTKTDFFFQKTRNPRTNTLLFRKARNLGDREGGNDKKIVEKTLSSGDKPRSDRTEKKVVENTENENKK